MHDINPRVAMITTICLGGLAVAGWRLLVAPLHGRLAAASAQTASLAGQVESLQRMALPDEAVLQQELLRVKEQNERLTAVSAPPDGNQLRERLRELATLNEVRIDRIERRNKLGSTHEAKQNNYSLREAVGFSMSVRGSYSHLAQFIQAIRADSALSRINSVKLSAASGADSQGVSALIETSHLRLVAPQAKPEPKGPKSGPGGPGAASNAATKEAKK